MSCHISDNLKAPDLSRIGKYLGLIYKENRAQFALEMSYISKYLSCKWLNLHKITGIAC